MNVANILKVADAMEGHTLPALGFNMAGYICERAPTDSDHPDMSGHNCGTVACVAGWTCSVLSVDLDAVEDVHDDARLLLDLTERESMDLFVPNMGEHTYWSNTITPAHAVRVLRILAITGKVDWAAATDLSDPVLPPLPASKALTVRPVEA